MSAAVIQEVSRKSFGGQITFPEVVGKLLGIGVDSYRADLVQNQKVFFFGNGEVHAENFEFKGPQIPASFSGEKVVAAIRASQAGQINYQEFLNRAMLAGVSSYTAYLIGRKVIYTGRNGDFHVEHFPK